VLPSEIKRCTLVITRIRTSADSQYHVQVTYRTREELNQFLKDPSLELTSADVQKIKKSCENLLGTNKKFDSQDLASAKKFIADHVKEDSGQYVSRILHYTSYG